MLKYWYLKYENASNELVGWILTGIPPTSCQFRILPIIFHFRKQMKDKLKDLHVLYFCLVFPIQHSKLMNLSHILLAIFIYHENWTFLATPKTCPLRSSRYFSFIEKYLNHLIFVKTSLPWENDSDFPVLTGILIYCSLLNRLMEAHTL